MPVLNWIGKEAVLKHHKEVPFRLLEPVPELSCGDPDSGNLIVQGDNLHALKALLPRYAGQVKCIYIDPPYNTGNEGWAYNDNVNSPQIRKWLGETVLKEGETLDRHDRWLCMMYPRLVLLKQFLTHDGVILVSLDDIELGVLKCLLDEIFGKSNSLGTIVWNTRNTDNRIKTYLSPDHEYILVYGKSPEARIEGRIIDRSDFKNPDKDPRGPYVTDPLTGKATADERPNLHAYNMEQPDTDNVWEPDQAHGWITDEAGYKKLLADKRIWWPPSPRSGKPRKKRFLFETKARMPASTFWPEFKTQSGASDLDDILDERVFAFPKPVQVIQRIIDYCAPQNSIILDSFGGSGTTAHAVMRQNAADNGGRKFILVEMDENIAKTITSERVRRLSEGFTGRNGQRVPGFREGFQYYRLSSEPLFEPGGPIRSDVTFDQLAEFVWFMETGAGIGKMVDSEGSRKFSNAASTSPYLGTYKDRAVFLLYNGILKDRSDLGGNVLNRRTLELLEELLPGFEGMRIVYGARSRFDKAKLAKLNITFHQLPYDLAVKTWF
jgi:DNA modification methylase